MPMQVPLENTPDSLWIALIVVLLFMIGEPWRRRK